MNTTTTNKGQKFAAILEAIKANPNLKLNEIPEVVKAKTGLDVSLPSVYAVSGHMKANKNKKKAAVTEPTPVSVPASPPVLQGLDTLLAVKKFATEVGGIDNLISLANTLKQVAA
jgi:hypothetical protein